MTSTTQGWALPILQDRPNLADTPQWQEHVGGIGHLPPARTLIAVPAIPVKATTEMAAYSSISIFARRVSGSVSVGLNAKLVAKATNRLSA